MRRLSWPGLRVSRANRAAGASLVLILGTLSAALPAAPAVASGSLPRAEVTHLLVSSPATSARAAQHVLSVGAGLPLAFVGLGRGVYRAAGPGYTATLAGATARLTLGGQGAGRPAHAVTLSFVGARPLVLAAASPLAGRVNVFVGANPTAWQRGLTTSAQVVGRMLYPGITLLWHGRGDRLEYDLRLAPGADAARVRLRLDGVRTLRRAADGALVLTLPGGGVLRQEAPVATQPAGRGQRAARVTARFTLLGGHSIGLVLGPHDRRRAVVIDPTLIYSTFFAGNTVVPLSVVTDRAGNMILCGTAAGSLPLVGALQTGYSGATAFVTKINAAGTAVIFSTYVGGATGGTTLNGLALDPAANIYLTGATSSSTFPTTTHTLQTVKIGATDAFITKLSADGTHLVYSTYLGGSTDNANSQGDNEGLGIAVDAGGSAYVTGVTQAYNWPLVPAAHPYQGALGRGTGALGSQRDAFVVKLAPAGNALTYSTYLGGSGDDSGLGIAVDSHGAAIVEGLSGSADFPISAHALQSTLGGTQTPFLCRFTPAGTATVFCTFLGASDAERIHGLALDTHDNIYVAGVTGGGILNTLAELQPRAGQTDAFLVKFDKQGVLVYATYLGGAGNDLVNGLAVTSSGEALVAGSTDSQTFTAPGLLLKKAIQGELGGSRGGFGMTDAYLAEVNRCGNQLLFSSYLGGTFADSASAVTIDRSGTAVVAGVTGSPNFPLRHPLNTGFVPSQDAFLAKIALSPAAAPAHCPVPLTLEFPTQNLARTIVLTTHTAPRAAVSITLQIMKGLVPATLDDKGIVAIRQMKVVYRLRSAGHADAFGLYHAHFQVLYTVASTLPGLITLVARDGAAVSTAQVPITVQPISG